MDSTEEVTSITGYLHRRSRKKYLPFWHRFYCVLNGRLLLFYKTEEHYRQLQAFRDVLDLGLVYEIKQALGLDYGIVISTHTGPYWLRVRTQPDFEKWFTALQAAVVLKNPKETLTRLTQQSAIQARQSLNVNSLEPKATSGESSRLRLSLDVIPDAKYSTYDGGRSPRLYGSDTGFPFQDKADQAAAKETTDEPQGEQQEELRDDVKRRKKFSSIRPISGSVSNFLQMAIQAHFHTNDESRNRSKTFTGSTGTVQRKKSPRLPTSPALEKFISNTDESDIKSSMVDTEKIRKPRKQVEFAQDLENQQNIEIHPESSQESCQDPDIKCQVKNETVTQETEITDKQLDQSDDVKLRTLTEKCSEEDTPCKDTKKKEKVKEEKKTKRRKSSLALIKEFFFPSKSKQKVEQSNPEQKENPDQDLANPSTQVSPPSDICPTDQQDKPESLQSCQTDKVAVEKEQNESGLEDQVNQQDVELTGSGLITENDVEKSQGEKETCQLDDDSGQQNTHKTVLRQISEERDSVIEEPYVAVVAPVYETDDEDETQNEPDLLKEIVNEIGIVKVDLKECNEEELEKAVFLEIIEPDCEITGTECPKLPGTQEPTLDASLTEKLQEKEQQIQKDNQEINDQHKFQELHKSFPSDSESLNRWRGYWKSDEIPLLRDSTGSADTISPNIRYLSYQEEKGPPLPIKTRIRSPSPPYDIPRSIPLAVLSINVEDNSKENMLEVEMAAILSEDIRVNETADVAEDNDFVIVSNSMQTESSSTAQLESSFQITEPTESIADLSNEPEVSQDTTNQQKDGTEFKSCVSSLISRFETPGQTTVLKRKHSKPKEEHRLSYASTETEIVEEGVVKELVV